MLRIVMISAALSRVVLGVILACREDLAQALRARHPEVGRACVVDHKESFGRSSKGNRTEVFRVLKIADRNLCNRRKQNPKDRK
jgi:hypothetical protein